MCVGVYTPKHTFFWGVHTTVDRNRNGVFVYSRITFNCYPLGNRSGRISMYLVICMRCKMVTREPLKIERRLFTIEEYDRFIEAGVLTEDDPVELINGEVVKMSPISGPHAGCVARLSMMFSLQLGQQVVIWTQNPIHIDQYSEPEPDVVVLRYRQDFYTKSLPRPIDVLLLIEVADTSLSYDRRVKVPLYAKVGILEIWVMDVENRLIYVYRNPVNGKYQETLVMKPGDTITPVTFSEILVKVDEII